jgi:preprotein translocase subunit SecG
VHVLTTTLWSLLVVTSLAIIGLVLLHRGRGGGISDMFGGGLASGIQSSGSGEKNLGRITWGVIIVWSIVIILLGLVNKYSA